MKAHCDSNRRVSALHPVKLMALSLFVLVCGPPQIEAQVAGTISGYARDQSGGVIPGAEVAATLVGQQLTRVAVADDTGFFNLLAMPRGTYQIVVVVPGFEKQLRSVELTAGEHLRVDFTLRVGRLDQEVTVTAGAVMVDTKTPTMSDLVDDRRVQDLPLAGRNIIALARVLPGVVGVSAPQEMGNTRSGPILSSHGGTQVHNVFTLNNANFTSFAQTTGFNPPPPDAVQEIRIQTHNFTAEYGHNSGAQVSVVSKSGSNEFHGSIWEFLRNDRLNARSFFQTRRPGQRQNQAGAAAGGPIVRNKLFFFGSYQRLWNRRESGSSQAFLPTDRERLGDFSASGVTLKNPVDPTTGKAFVDPSGNSCVAGNVINARCISPVAQKYLDRFIPRAPTGVIQLLSPNASNSYNWTSRFDYLLSKKSTLSGHLYRDHYDTAETSSFPGFVTSSSFNDIYNLGVSNTHTFSPTFLNEATFSYIYANSYRGPITKLPPREMGINVDEGPLGEGMSLSVSGRFSLSFTGVEEQTYRNWHFRQVTTKIRGNHTFKWGYELLQVGFHLGFSTDRNASFTGVRSGDATADLLLGAFDRSLVGFGIADSDPIAWKHMFFFQNEYKATPRLTLNWGVRYEPWLPWRQEFDHYTSFKPGVQSVVKPDAPPGILFPGDPGLPDKTVHNDLNNFAPRLGFAWDVFGMGRTVVRGGYGWFYNQISANSVHAAEAPWRGTVQMFNGRIEDPFGSLNLTAPPSGAPLPGDFGCSAIAAYPGLRCPLYPLPISMVWREPNLKTPTIHSWNLSIQKQVTQDLMFDFAYVGKIGYKLEGHRHFNPARFIDSPITGRPPTTGNVNERVIYNPGIIGPLSRVLGTEYRSWYHGFQIRANKRFSSGFSFQGSYSLAKNLDTILSVSPGLTGGVANPFDLSTMKGRANLDYRHVLAFSWIWEPPVKFSNRVLDGVFGGWTLTGLHNLRSGAPLTFTMGTDVSLDGTGGAGRQYAQLVEGATRGDIERNHSSRDDFILRFFNASAFVPVATLQRGIYGNSGRGILSGPANVDNDVAVMKNFKLLGPESLRLQIRAEFFNAFNNVNFSSPNTSRVSSNFGRITGAGGGRQVQLAAKILW